MGPLIGGSPCRLLILRNANVHVSVAYLCPCNRLNFRNSTVTCQHKCHIFPLIILLLCNMFMKETNVYLVIYLKIHKTCENNPSEKKCNI